MKKKGKMLVRTGPYAIVRNPLYIGNILIATGLSILSGFIWLVPFLIFYFYILNYFVVLYEEKKVLSRWGDEYQTYLSEVPRWMPRVKEWHGVKTSSFTWIGIYSIVIRFEEGHLLEKYRDGYRKYLLGIPRWLPKGLTSRSLNLINKSLYRVASIELSGVLILLPYVFKEVLYI